MSENIPTVTELLSFDSRDQLGQIMAELIDLAEHEICFFGPNLDPVLFDEQTVIDKLSEFARRSPRTQIRFVVFDTRKNIAQRHRLIPLIQRLTSKISVHIASRKHQELLSMYVLIDTKAYLYCPNAERYVGRAEKHAPAKVRDMLKDFEEIWTHSKQDINTRRLHI